MITRLAFAFLGILLTVTVARSGGFVGPAALANVALTVVSPPSGLLLVAGLLPLGSVATGFFEQPVPLVEVLVMSFLAGVALRSAGRPTQYAAVPHTLSLLALGIAVSYAVHLAGFREQLGPAAFHQQMLLLLRGGYFTGTISLDQLQTVAAFLEGLGLFAATATILAAHPAAHPAFLRCLALGAGAAAALNVNRLLTIVVATGEPWSELIRFARAFRINVHYSDINAAGSYFAMMVFVALALAFATAGARRILWSAVSAVIAAALWLTSSRAALGAVCVTIGGALLSPSFISRPSSRVRWRLATAVPLAVLLLIACVALIFLPNRVIGPGASTAIEIRKGLAIASFRMLSGAPVFGIGIGQFYPSSETTIRDLPVGRFYTRENAHNMFLQLLTELGIVGFLLFLVLLVAVGRRAIAGLRLRGTDVSYNGPVWGAVAFLISGLLGHPLLTPTVAHAFWMTLGSITALPHVPTSAVVRRGRAAAALVALVLIVSLPFRAAARSRSEVLEHVGYGLSAWRIAEDGTRYRVTEATATVFAPAVAVVEVPLRLDAPDDPPTEVNVLLESRLVNRIYVSGGEWTRYRVQVRQRSDRLYVPITFSIAAGRHATLRVGKVAIPPGVE